MLAQRLDPQCPFRSRIEPQPPVRAQDQGSTVVQFVGQGVIQLNVDVGISGLSENRLVPR